jgi:hypothetical protein
MYNQIENNDNVAYQNEEEQEEQEIITKNLCVNCNIDIGPNNPRQLCGKTYCIYDDIE